LKLFQSIIYSNRNKSVNWYIFANAMETDTAASQPALTA